MTTKGLILCAGLGSRLRPLTYSSAKHLIPVANTPIVHYIVRWLRDAGITEIGVVVGANRHEIAQSLADGSDYGVDLTYISQDTPLGTAHAVSVAESFIDGASFVMILGDNLFQHGLNAFVDQYRASRPDAMVMLHRTDRPQDFGIADVKDGVVVGLEEKPLNPKSDMAVAGVYTFTPLIFDAIRQTRPSSRGELELPDAVRVLINAGHRVVPFLHQGWWKDTGRPEDIIDLNRLLLQDLEDSEILGTVDDASALVGKVHLGKGAVVERSRIVGPAVIGPGTTIRDAYIGPYTSIGKGCSILGSEVEFGVVMDETTIEGIGDRIGSSLIGKQVKISRNLARPLQNVFVVGDRSEVRILTTPNGH